jgi:hypothetical protein
MASNVERCAEAYGTRTARPSGSAVDRCRVGLHGIQELHDVIDVGFGEHGVRSRGSVVDVGGLPKPRNHKSRVHYAGARPKNRTTTLYSTPVNLTILQTWDSKSYDETSD